MSEHTEVEPWQVKVTCPTCKHSHTVRDTIEEPYSGKHRCPSCAVRLTVSIWSDAQ